MAGTTGATASLDTIEPGTHGGGATLDGMAIPGGADQHFAARLSPDGVAIWTTELPLASPVRPADIDVTEGGDVVVAGDTEVWTLDGDGNLGATLSVPGVRIEDLDLGSDGSIHLAGSFTGTVDIQGTMLTATDFASDAFVARFDADGTLQWAVAAGAEFLDTANGMSVADDGTIFVTGSLQPGAQVGSTDGNPQAIDVANLSAFLAIYDGDGVLGSVYASAGNGTEDGRPISAISAARVVFGGHVNEDYDGTARTAVEGTSSFVHTFDGDGTPGDLLLATGNAVELYGLDCAATLCAVAGRFQNSATFDGDTVDQVGAQLDGFVGVVATP